MTKEIRSLIVENYKLVEIECKICKVIMNMPFLHKGQKH